MKRVIRILNHAATHAAGVVGKNAAHHTGINRRGVGSDAASVRFKRVVEEPAHKSGLEADVPCVVCDTVLPPMFGDIHENPIGHGLTGETRPGRAEGHGYFVLLRKFEEGLNFADGVGLNDSLWDESKIGSVVGVGDAMQIGCEDAGRMD